jgi:hypothetical protein
VNIYYLAGLLFFAQARIFNFTEEGAVANQTDIDTEWFNMRLLNFTLNVMERGDTLLIPNETFHVMGGIEVYDRVDITI